MPLLLKRRTVLPGFGLSLGYAVLYLSLIVLVPLAAIVHRTSTTTWAHFWGTVSRPDVVSALKLSFGAAAIAAIINAVFGLLCAWVLVRYRFPGKRIVDAMIDLPFALPTAVAGIALTTIYARNGWLGGWVESALTKSVPIWRYDPARPADGHFLVDWQWWRLGIPWVTWDGFGQSWWPLGVDFYHKVVFTPIGVTLALTFIGLPFVVRTVQPVLEDMSKELEEAAASLGATRWQTFRRVVFPEVWPALITGATLAFARAVGEYGSVVFIAGNLPMRTEIAPLMIIKKLEEYDYTGATSIAIVMLVISFVLLLAINMLQRWTAKRAEAEL
jgi:sulfate transport system permease protein